MVVYENETRVEVKAKEQMPKLVAAGLLPNGREAPESSTTSAARPPVLVLQRTS